MIQKSVSIGLIDLEGWVTSGRLTLRGTKPSDTWTLDQEGIVQDSYDRVWQDSLIVMFGTQRHDIAKEGEIRQFVRFWLETNNF